MDLRQPFLPFVPTRAVRPLPAPRPAQEKALEGALQGGAAQNAGGLADLCELPSVKPGGCRPLSLSLGRLHGDAAAPRNTGLIKKGLAQHLASTLKVT